MAAVVQATSQFVATGSVTTGSVPLPTGWQANDVLYIFADLAASTGTITAPTGYTTLVANFHSAATTSATMALFRKVLTATESAPSVTCKSGRLTAIGVLVRGADVTSGPEDGTAASDVNTSITYPNVEAPSVSPTGSNSLLLCGFGEYDGTTGISVTFTPPSGMTEVNDQSSAVAGSSNVGLEVSSLALTASGATGAQTATASATTHTTVGPMGVSVAVLSAAGGGTTVNLPVAQVTVTAPAPTVSVSGSLPVAQETVAAPTYGPSFLTTFDTGTTQGWTANTSGTATVVINSTAAHDGADGADFNIISSGDTVWLSQSVGPAPSVTVDGWFQVAVEGPSGTNIPFCSMISNGTRIAKAYRQNVSGLAEFEYCQTDGTTHTFVPSTLVLSTGTWHHYVFTWNINGTFFLAVDGQQLLQNYTPTGFFSAPSIDTIYLGAERAGNPGTWYVDTVTVMPTPMVELSVPLAVAQVNVAAPAPTVTAGGQLVSLTTAQVNVAALALSPGVTLSLPVAQVTAAAPAPSLSSSLTLTTARVNVAAPAPSAKIQLTLPVAQVAIGALAPSPKVQLGLAVAQVVINAPAPTVSAGGGGQIVSLTTALVSANARAPSPQLTLGLARAQVSVAALAPSSRLSLALTTAQVTATAFPVTAGVGNAPPLGPDTGGTATGPRSGGSASSASDGGSATSPSSGGTIT